MSNLSKSLTNFASAVFWSSYSYSREMRTATSSQNLCTLRLTSLWHKTHVGQTANSFACHNENTSCPDSSPNKLWIFSMASFSILCLSSLHTLSAGVRSPTIHSAISCTSEIFMHLKQITIAILIQILEWLFTKSILRNNVAPTRRSQTALIGERNPFWEIVCCRLKPKEARIDR